MTPKLALSLAALLATTPALAQTAAPAPPSIVVEGQASANVVPDVAILSLGVALQRPRAPEVMDAVAKAVGRVVATLTQEGVAPDDIKTAAVELSPVTDEPKTGAPKVVAYQASTQLRVTVRPVDKAGPLQSKLIEGGINTIDDVSFAIGDEAALRDRLKGEAARDARRQAGIYAAGLGVGVGRVLDIRPERSAGTVRSRPSALPVRMAVAPMPIEAGREGVTERVTVTFALTQDEPAPGSK